MKTLILITSLVLSTITYSSTTLSEQEELQKRLELYGLIQNKEPIPYFDKADYDTSIIQKLQNEIKTNYTSKLESKFGSCDTKNCIENNTDHKSLKLANKTICLPYTECGFYNCMEKKYQCKPEGVNYFTELAFPTCSTYIKNIEKKWFSQAGHDWIYTVMVCLQKGLIDECEYDENCKKESSKKTCDYITNFTLKFHPGCYTNSGVGVCKLPLKDKINIWRTVGKYLTTTETQEAIKVVLGCIKSGY